MKPRVFVSSTFYDLHQIRERLRGFLDDLGYQPLLSEHRSFPVDPTESTVENCKLQVEREADIFILIVGRRYGSLDSRSLRSVTNLEYLAARGKRVPIYAFIDKALEPVLQRWRSDPQQDFSTEVDNAEVLRFVDRIRSTDSVWTFSFETDFDIVETLRLQFSHLMSQGLSWWRRVHSGPEVLSTTSLTGRSLRLALEQPPGWEYFLLAQVLGDEVARYRHLRDEHMDNLAIELGEDVGDPVAWGKNRFIELGRVVHSLDPLVNVCANRAIGKSGEPGDTSDLVFVGRAIGRVYGAVLEWSRRVRTANIRREFEFTDVLEVFAQFTNEVIEEIESYGPRVRTRIETALPLALTGIPQDVDLRLTLRLSDDLVAAFNRALERTRRAYERHRN